MANRKLSIGCVLIMGGALTNCGGTVETRSDTGNEHGGGSGGSGFVGVPPNGGFTGAVGTMVAGATGIGFGGYVGTCCPGGGAGGYSPGAGAGGYVGLPIGSGGAPGTIAEGGWGNQGGAAEGGETSVGGESSAGYGGEEG
jgi:hypothetical protein